jgi:hypothetical protein
MSPNPNMNKPILENMEEEMKEDEGGLVSIAGLNSRIEEAEENKEAPA